jgi:hypothetical protein
MSSIVTSPFLVFYDRTGQPLDAGYIYIGTAGINPEVSPITVYWDTSLTTSAAQPIRTLAGYPSRDGSPGTLIINQASYSIVVRDKNGTLVFSDLNVLTSTATTPETVANIAALRLLNALTINTQVLLLSNYVTGDGGGIFGIDTADIATADNSGTVIVDAIGRRWKRQFDGILFEASWFGVIADDATDNTSPLNNAITAAANCQLILPPGTFRAGVVALASPIHIMGALTGTTVWKRRASSNDFGITATSIDGIRLSNFTLNANIAQNAASGAHGGISFTTCTNMQVTDVKLIDWRGTFSGSPVGSGLSVSGGTGGIFTRVYAESCYDGLLLNQHDFWWTDMCRFVSCVRWGALYNDCDDWVDNNSFAVLCGTDVTLDASCGGIVAQNCKRWVSNSPQCKDSAYGYGFQIQIDSDDWVLNSPIVRSNAWDGVGITGGVSDTILRGRVVGGYGVSNRASNLAVNDASTDITVVGFVDGGASLQGINVFRSTAHLLGCYGDVTVWDAGVISAVSITTGGAAYTDGTFTAVPLVGPTWYTDGLGRSSATANITVSGGIVTVATLNYAGNLALPPTSLTTLTAPSLAGGAGATFTITLVGASSNTCQGSTITDGHNGGTLRIQSGAVTTLPVTNCGFTTTTGATTVVVPEYKSSGMRVLFKLISANMNSVADQQFTKVGSFTTFIPITYRLVNPSISMTTAAGGVYTGAGKTGDILVAAAQTYATASTVGTSSQAMTATALGSGVRTETPYLSLTTAQGVAATADIYIFGTPLS